MCIYSRISKNFCPPTFQPLHNSVTLFQSTCVHVFLICKSVLYIHTCRCICMKMLVCANVIFSCTVKYEKRGAGGMGKAAKLLASWYQVLGTERGRNRKRQTNPYIYIYMGIDLSSFSSQGGGGGGGGGGGCMAVRDVPKDGVTCTYMCVCVLKRVYTL